MESEHGAYWDEFREYCQKFVPGFISNYTEKDHCLYRPFGPGGVSLVLCRNARSRTYPNNVKVEILLQSSDKSTNKQRFDRLLRDQPSLERRTRDLEWHRSPNLIRSRIALHSPVRDPADRRDWKRQYEWLVTTAKLFEDVFLGQMARLR